MGKTSGRRAAMGAGDPSGNLDPGSRAVACAPEQTVLGEGAVWDARRDELLRVDILAGRVYRDRVGGDGELIAVRDYRLPGTARAIAPIAGDDGWLLAADRGFAHLGVDGVLRARHRRRLPGRNADERWRVRSTGPLLGRVACRRPSRRSAGRCTGSTGTDGPNSSWATSRIPNGLDWSPDGTTMYLVDSGPGIVDAFAFDAVWGTVSAAADVDRG